MQPFTLLIKPTGSDCNLDCRYCFYKNRAPQIGTGRQRMSYEVLEKLVKDYMSLRFSPASFSWQGGEPTLMGLDFYKKVVDLQKNYGCPGQIVSNTFQTNAILLDENWCRFLGENNFLVGISMDGPQQLHDHYRIDHAGNGSFEKVRKAIDLCKEYAVEFNVLVLLNDKNVEQPNLLFDFFVENEIRYLQFIPCVETDPATGRIADFAVKPQQYGQFLCRLFDRWYDYGPENLSIRDFDSILSYILTGQHTICTFSRQCSQYIVVEHTGDCFPCDFFVRPQLKLGNIFESPIEMLANGVTKKNFARAKQNIGNKCLVCPYLSLCRGGCMKDRAVVNSTGPAESYLCQGYKRFFDYSMPRFMQIAARIRAGS